MAFTFDDDPEAFIRQAEIDAANTPEARAMAEIDRSAARIDEAGAALDAANERAARMAARDPNVYNPDRPSTWNAPDNPNLTTLDRARNIQPSAEATSMAQAARAAALSGDDGASLRAGAESRLRERSEAAGRALDTPAEQLAAMRLAGGRQQFGDAFDALGQRVVSSRPNPAYPSTSRYTGAMLGDGSVRQDVGPDGQPRMRMETVEEPILGADGQPMPDPMNPQGPPLTRTVQRMVPVMETNRGLIGEGRHAAIRQQEAELDREILNTNLLADQAWQQRKIAADMEARDQMQRQKQEAARAAVDETHRAVELARNEFAKADDVNPDRGWAQKGVAAQIAAVIASGLLGFAGRDPFAHINAVIERDIDAQKSNIAKRRQAVDTAGAAHATAVSAYDQVRAQLGDERLADEAFRISALEQIKSEALAKLQNANVQVKTAEQQAFLNGLDQQIAEKRRGLELVAATTPQKIVRVSSPYTGAQQALLKEQAKSGLRMQERSGEQAVELVGKRQEQEREIRGKIDVERAKEAAGGPLSDKEVALLQTHVDDTKAAGAISDLIDDLASDYEGSDVPGRGVSRIIDWATPNDVADVETRLSLIEDSIGRMQSGGAITEDEAVRFRSWIRAGVGDEQLFRNLRNIQSLTSKKLKRSYAALPPKLQAAYRGIDEGALPRRDTDVSGGPGRPNRIGGEGGVVQVHE
ncbi:MAG TPA: hypothetical protein VJP45_01225 [Candidatus Limnocylindria bacterium]|nr:hypothetical protein [Candidatus Limnocylindria bacterium]